MSPFLRNQWYTAATSTELGDKPLARTICNEPLVIFRSGNGNVAVLTDRCPHRKAPLSSGEVVGNYMAPGMEIDVALRTYDIPHVWPEAVLKEAAKLKPEVEEKDKEKRVDLRHLPFVTIDGEDARDFDDAVYCEAKPGKLRLFSGGWKLYVAIADVSSYVKIGSALDNEAQVRGNSVYFPRRVIPMLPEELSNELCSLKPDVDRLVMVCEMEVTPAGGLGPALADIAMS